MGDAIFVGNSCWRDFCSNNFTNMNRAKKVIRGKIISPIKILKNEVFYVTIEAAKHQEEMMGKVYVLIGKSATGKDTVFSRLRESRELGLKTVVGYTTRPIRKGEEDGREYFFVSVEKWKELCAAGKVVETRTYHTVKGDWHYFTADDGQIRPDGEDCLFISTLEGFEGLRRFYGEDMVVPVYVEVEDGLRLTRALAREKLQKQPNYEELCRRFLADQKDFSEENIKRAGITKRYRNIVLDDCVEEIRNDILGNH